MSQDYRANLPFVYREIVSLEVQLLSGNRLQVREPYIFAFSEEGGAELYSLLALPWGILNFDLSDFLSVVRSNFVETRGVFPILVCPSLEKSCYEPLLEYLIAYEFQEVRFLALIQEKRVRARVRSGLALREGEEIQMGTEIRHAFLKEVESFMPQLSGMWKSLIDMKTNHPQLSWIYAYIGDELAGFGVYLVPGIQARLVTLYTGASWRGRGVGEAILSHFFRKAQESDAFILSSVVPEASTFKYYLGRFNFTEAFSFSIWFPPRPDFYKDA